eukprot:5341536-Pyramimonas_sp.AAC.1
MHAMYNYSIDPLKLARLLLQVAMDARKNVWVDGSLRDYEWYSKVFDDLRKKWPLYRIAILYVYADKEVVLERAARRAVLTGREVPIADLVDSIEKVPKSVAILSPKADFTAYISNNPPNPEPVLERTEVFGLPATCADTNDACWKQISSRFATAASLVE